MTRAIGTGDAGGASYSDAQAVGAVTAWREPQPPVIDAVPIPVSLVTFITVATMVTTALAGGVYRFTLALLTSGSNSGTLIELQVYVDGLIVFPAGPLYNFGDASARIPFTGDLPLVLTPGPHTIEVKAAHPASPGTASVDFSSLMMERYQ